MQHVASGLLGDPGFLERPEVEQVRLELCEQFGEHIHWRRAGRRPEDTKRLKPVRRERGVRPRA